MPDDSSRVVRAVLAPEVAAALDQLAAVSGMTVSAALRAMVTREVQRAGLLAPSPPRPRRRKRRASPASE